MAKPSIERMENRVSIVFDCDDEKEATMLFRLLASEALDKKTFYLKIDGNRIYIGERVG